MHKFLGWLGGVALVSGVLQFGVATIQAISQDENPQWLVVGMIISAIIAIVAGGGWYVTKATEGSSPEPPRPEGDSSAMSVGQTSGITAGRIDNLNLVQGGSPATPDQKDGINLLLADGRKLRNAFFAPDYRESREPLTNALNTWVGSSVNWLQANMPRDVEFFLSHSPDATAYEGAIWRSNLVKLLDRRMARLADLSQKR